MKYPDNISDLVKLAPDFIGFNFYSRSKRFVRNSLPVKSVNQIPSRIKRVGIFVNSRKAYIIRKVKEYKLDYVQLHGHESPEFCEDICKSVKVIKAFGVDRKFDFRLLDKYSPYCEYFLFDTRTIGYGGSGKTFDWKLLGNYRLKTPYFISGGVGLEELNNLKRQTSNVKPFAIDVNSKFEIKAGLKDIEKLKKLKHEVRG